jgi:putative transposase
MARKTRIWYPGATYHITSRGNRKAPLFHDDKDRYKYLSLLEETRERYPFHLHSYCLMTNHIHLQIETISNQIYEIMKMLNSLYAIYFNKRHDLVGHVFQGRYGAQIIESVWYFLRTSSYIHLNPVEAQIVKRPESYFWSSFSAYVSDLKNPHITMEKTLSPIFQNPRRSITSILSKENYCSNHYPNRRNLKFYKIFKLKFYDMR